MPSDAHSLGFMLRVIAWRVPGADGLADWRRSKENRSYVSGPVFEHLPKTDVVAMSSNGKSEHGQSRIRVDKQRE
jgi:hypothetical protein